MDSEEKQRIRKAKRLMERHPEHVPVIVFPENVKMSTVKFLPHKESSVGEFMRCLRGYTQKLKETEALLLFVSNMMPPMTETIGQLYRDYATPDGYLHMRLSKENTFG